MSADDSDVYRQLRRAWLIGFLTLIWRETSRFLRIWTQTLLPSVITMALYFLIFGQLIGERIGPMSGVSYIQYIVPGVIMMAILTNAYGNTVASFFGSKFQRNLEEMLVSPMPSVMILTGFVFGAVLRALIVGVLVWGVASLFTDVQILHPGVTFLSALLTAILFSTLGVINGIYATKFDDINLIPTFVLTPLTYLGGVFYSIEILPSYAQNLTQLNPIFYMVNAFRYGFYGLSDGDVTTALMIVFAFTVTAFGIAWRLIHTGTGIRT